MRILVLGSGLLGISTAYALGVRGHEVEVLERKSISGADTSFANGGQLSYSHAEPWANFTVLRKLPKWLLHEDSPLIFRPRLDWRMIAWGMGFLRNCTAHRARVNCINMLRLGLYSKQKMKELRERTNVQFDFMEKGIVHIFSTEKDLEAAIKHAEFQARFGCQQTVLSAKQCLEMEPALAHTSRTIVGGIHAHMDESGDAHVFCRALEEWTKANCSVKYHHDVEIKGIETEGGRVIAVHSSQGIHRADAYVVANGSYSRLLMEPLGIRLPIYPMKGYSITAPANEFSPQISITDGSHKIVYSRLGDKVRVAGTAEFAGYNHEVLESRIAPIVRAAKTLFPKMSWENLQKWACLRPSTPDGPPVLGPTPYNNLFLNTGHGTLGWTQAAGSAAIVADIIENKMPEIMVMGLGLERSY